MNDCNIFILYKDITSYVPVSGVSQYSLTALFSDINLFFFFISMLEILHYKKFYISAARNVL